MKKLILLTVFLFTALSLTPHTFTQEIDSSDTFLEYSLDSVENKVEKIYTNEQNEEVYLTIESIPSKSYISQGTYKVSKSVKGSWEVSFNVSINSSNHFTGTSNLNLKALKGSITSSSLTHTSTKATCSFKQKAGIITSSATVTATISNGKLVVK